MAWKATGDPTVRKQRGRWVVRVDGVDTGTGQHRPRQLGTYETARLANLAARSARADGNASARGTLGWAVTRYVESRTDLATSSQEQYAWAAGHIVKNERLATTGPYAHTRNPLYFGSFLIAAGFALAAHWSLLLLVIAFFVLVYGPTMERERANIRGRFPEAYAAWESNVPAFVPRITPWQAPDRVAAAVGHALEECGLSALADTHPYDLALPIRRMVAMASVLVTDPAVILLDEPTALLDRPTRSIMAELVRSRVERGATVLAVVHDPVFAIEALDRAISLERGRISADGSIEEVLRRGAAGLSLPATVQAAEGVGIRGASLRMQDLAAGLRGRVGG